MTIEGVKVNLVTVDAAVIDERIRQARHALALSKDLSERDQYSAATGVLQGIIIGICNAIEAQVEHGKAKKVDAEAVIREALHDAS